jgi:hypothetical protein
MHSIAVCRLPRPGWTDHQLCERHRREFLEIVARKCGGEFSVLMPAVKAVWRGRNISGFVDQAPNRELLQCKEKIKMPSNFNSSEFLLSNTLEHLLTLHSAKWACELPQRCDILDQILPATKLDSLCGLVLG